MSDEEFLRQIKGGNFLTSDKAPCSSGTAHKTGGNTRSIEFESEIDRLLAEAKYLMNSPVGNLRESVVNRPPERSGNRPQRTPANQLPEKPASNPQRAPANRPPERPLNRPPEKPAGNPQRAPANRPPERPVNRPPEKPVNPNRESVLNDNALSRELLDQMKVLTKEVRLLRSQLQTGANNQEAAPVVEPKNRYENKRGAEMSTKKKGKFWWVGEVAFYLVLVAIIVGAFLIKSNSGGRPTLIAGFSGFTVLTSSMEDTIPKGSLVITKAVDPNSLEIGDDITYMSSATATITHRIIEIREDYLDTNARAFITKGTMNKNQDKNPVAAANIVGKVVFHSKVLGQMAAFLSKNWPIVLFVVVILVGLAYVLKRIFASEEPTKGQSTVNMNKPHGNRGKYGK